MAILDFLKKDEEAAEKKTTVAKKKKATVVSEKKPAVVKKRGSSDAYRILKSPHISEKATDLNQKDQYVFKVWPKACKVEIKKAIQELYGVKIINVKIIKVPSKKKRVGRTIGIKKGYKKAIVRVEKGQKIEILAQ